MGPTISVEQIPHPMAAPASQMRGATNFDATVAGTWPAKF